MIEKERRRLMVLGQVQDGYKLLEVGGEANEAVLPTGEAGMEAL
jgi:hypothetical protein